MILPSSLHIIRPDHPALTEVEQSRIVMLKQMAVSLAARADDIDAFALAYEFTKMAALDFLEIARRMGFDPRSLQNIFFFEEERPETLELHKQYVSVVTVMLENAPPYLPTGWAVGRN